MRDALEKDLIGEIISSQSNVESGRDVTPKTQSQQTNEKRTKSFETLQGVRRRHPGFVLSQFAGIAQTNDTPYSNWEKAMEEENEKSSLSKVYSSQGDQMAVQLGLVQTANENFKKSKEKLSTFMLSSV